MITQNMIKSISSSMKNPKKGDIVVKFHCNGCMATEHDFQYVGKIIKIYRKKIGNGGKKKYKFCNIKILKADHYDVRDGVLGDCEELVDDGSFQQISKKVWCIFK